MRKGIKMQPKARYLLLLLTLAQFLTACSPTRPSSPDQVVITFACSKWERQEYERLAELFHQAHAHITVQVLSRDSIIWADREQAIRKLATSADTFAYPGDLLPRHTREGLVRDLTPFIEADSTFEAADFYPGLLEQFQWDGGTWALPVHTDLALIFYDKTAFEQANSAPPSPGWTFEEFSQAAQQLTIREGKRVVRYGFVNPLSDLTISLVLGRAGVWADSTVTPLLPRLDDPAIVEAVRWYTDLALRHGVMPNPAQFDEPELSTLILDGRAAMWTDYFSQLWRYAHLGVGVVPLPEETIVGWKWATGYAMSAGTAHPQECWQWLAFLTHQRLTGLESAAPPRRSVTETSGRWEELDEEVAEVYRYILEKPQAVLSVDPALGDSLLAALDTILAGEQKIEEALAEARVQALAAATTREESTPPPPVLVPTPEPRKGEEITIKFYHDAALGAYYALAEKFHDEHPEINVEFIEPEQWGVSHWAEECDCFAIYTSAPFRETPRHDVRYFLNLQPFLDAETDFPLDDFYPQFLEVFHWRGNLMGLPVEGDLKLMYYNKDLFDEAGVEYPQPGWDLQDFLEKAVTLTNGEGESKIYGYVPIGHAGVDLDFFLEQQGATTVDVAALSSQPQLDDPAVVAGVRWYADLAMVYGLMPNLLHLRTEERYSQTPAGLVSAGRVAMWTDYSTDYHGRTPHPPHVGIAPLPVGWRQMSIRQHGITGYVISVNSAHPQACWEWLKFLTKHSAAVVQGLPSRRSVAESPQYRIQVEAQALEVYLFTLEHTGSSLDAVYGEYPWLYTTHYWLYEALDSVLGGTDAERALAEAQVRAQAYADCLGEEARSGNERLYNACAQEADIGFPSGLFEVIDIDMTDIDIEECESESCK